MSRVTKPGAAPDLVDLRSSAKIDLHRHLLGSARPETLWELARFHDVPWGRKSLIEFRNAVVHESRPRTLEKYIAPWGVFRNLVQSAEDIRRIAFEAATDAQRDGVRYVEFRTSLPGLPITDGDAPQTRIRPVEFLRAIDDAFSQTPGIVCRVVASITRHAFGPAPTSAKRAYAEEFFNIVEQFRELIVGMDLSGLETGWPSRSFKELFAPARAMKLPITIHAGETEGPDEVWAAIDDLGASRIGHGTSAPKDRVLVEELIRRHIILEVCPTASWLVGTIKERYRHPVIDCDLPIPYVICTDNPTLNASTLSHEIGIGARIANQDARSFAGEQFLQATSAVFAPSALFANSIHASSVGPN